MSVILFHRTKNKKIKVCFNDTVLKKVEKIGFIFDRRLIWKSHIEYFMDKCQKRINILKSFAGSKWEQTRRL